MLTPDGLRLICAGFDNDSERNGIHMLERLAKYRNLYDPDSMPSELRKAHQSKRSGGDAGLWYAETGEAACVASLMRLYQEKEEIKIPASKAGKALKDAVAK